MHAAAAKTGRLAGGVKPRHDPAVAAEHPRIEIGLEPAQRLAGQDVELHRNQGPMLGIENPVRFCGADQPVADIFPRVVDVHHLRVLDVRICDLAVARLDLDLQIFKLQEIVANKRIHGGHKLGEVVAHDEIHALGLERFDRSGCTLVDGAPRGHPPALAGQIGILLRARQREFLLDDALGEHEPGIVVTGGYDVLQLAERVGAGKQRRG